ncbi:leucine--tRNA ligase [Patescibacteria group bacterium]|nr:leucine--tRNA ligase [Patescibacteria group bacterium]MBU1877272.1 leucine--tRNA ligase [Patescibacteria group bacterium]
MKYSPQEIESKWQKYWEENNFYQAQDFSKKKKLYILIEFPYPSGAGLHVGHCRPYSALDAVARKKRMEGFNVLFPIGWDAFGLPTENYAIKTGIHPSIATKKNISNFKKQLKSLGVSFDWNREINTTDPDYYKWTQWIFLKFFENGLAYQSEIPVNWCPSCKIGLANEEVIDNKCERCGTMSEQKKIKQWMLGITKYADRLIDDLKEVDFCEKIKTQQINWIGRSYGTEIDFKTDDELIKVFTTRADTIFGVTAIVLAPEHRLIENWKLKIKNWEKVQNYIKKSREKTEFERIEIEKKKTGVQLKGIFVNNPINNEKVSVWVGDYVIGTYGGGAVMVVPAHDKRDYDFAKEYGIEIKEVVSGGNISEEAFVDYGTLINSGDFDGLSSKEAIEKITDYLKKKKLGRKTVKYKLRDWIFSRQHYWGEPIPVIHCPKCGAVAVPEKDLPVQLPYIEKYQPTTTGESPLATISEWINVQCPKCNEPAKRETDTMPNWAGSSWYYLAYLMQGVSDFQFPISKYKKVFDYWLPVDWYNGGMEHTTLHLLYSRFWHKFLFDIGMVPNLEPYQKRTSHGMILAEDGRKMSKSFNNVINPEEVVSQYGADALRVYEMFMGPFDQTIIWNTQGVSGVYRFLDRIWNLVEECKNNTKSDDEAIKLIHKLNKKIDEDLENIKFNTAIAAFMEFLNFATANKEKIGQDIVERIVLLLAPFAPHISEELWHSSAHSDSVHQQKWPQYDSKMIREERINLIIQINGKVRDKIEIETGLSEKEATKMALSQEKVKTWIKNQEIKKVIFIPDQIINFVI